MKAYRHYGKKWTLEWNTDHACWITDAASAYTLEVRRRDNKGFFLLNVAAWFRVPPYLRNIITRRLIK